MRNLTADRPYAATEPAVEQCLLDGDVAEDRYDREERGQVVCINDSSSEKQREFIVKQSEQSRQRHDLRLRQ